ncbi:MAG: hypothetical protein EAS51_07095 [Microbacteriaceae bacterium]|nr:MAG: hypothetical protein EAS51_07095 [Microbacteriaceae bacterium]
MRVALPVVRGHDPLPLLGLLLGVLDPPGEPGAIRVHEAHRPVGREPSDGFACRLGRGDQAAVGAVALERGGELLPRVLQIRGDDVVVVRFPCRLDSVRAIR